MKILSGKLPIAIIIILCIVSRLPQLLSDNLVLDGDECVVGLMAKHILTLKDFSLFFYGQDYGFSFIECLTIIPFYAVAGITTISVKSAMLLLWTIGIILMYKAYLQINTRNSILPFFLILIFMCTPAWAVWSMKARGGYLTSFMLTSLLLYLFFHQKVKFYLLFYSFIGVLLVLIYESQPLWLPGILPFLLYQLSKDKSIQKLVAFLIPSSCIFVAFYFYRKGLPNLYAPQFVSPGIHVFTRIFQIPYFLFSSLHGNYFSYQVQKPNVFTALFAYLFCGVIFFLCMAVLYNLMKRKGDMLFNLSVLSVVLTILCPLFFEDVYPRYFLPVTGYTLLSVLFFLQTAKIKKELFIPCSCLIIMGIISLITFKDYQFSTMTKNKLGQIITYLANNQVHYVYCYDYMLTYQALFYSKEKILTHERFLPGRYPLYPKQVDSALNNGAKTALIFNELQLRDMEFKNVNQCYGYLVVFDPPKNELAKIFQLEH